MTSVIMERKNLSLKNAPARWKNAPPALKTRVVLPPFLTKKRLRMKALNCPDLPCFAKSVGKQGC